MRIALIVILILLLLLIVFSIQSNCVCPDNYPEHQVWANHPTGSPQVYNSFWQAVTMTSDCFTASNGDDYCRLRWIGNMQHYLLAREAGAQVYKPTYAVYCLLPWY